MRATRLGENIAREWSEEPRAPELWDALQLIEANAKAGVEKLEQLANSGSPLAKVYLGDLLLKGEHGVARNDAAGLEWLRRSADDGSVEGEYGLAWHLLKAGEQEGALVHYEHLASVNYAPALYALGSLYYKGQLVERSHETALRYLLRSAALGHLHAATWACRIRMRRERGLGVRIRAVAEWVALIVPLLRMTWNYPASDQLRI